MQVITNTKIIENRSKWAKRLSPIAMLALLGGFFLNLYTIMYTINQPEYTQYIFGLLMIGLVLSMFSSNLVNRWVREPRSDQAFSNTLKKFEKDYYLFNYTGPAPHILLTPTRLYVLVAKRQTGQVTVKGDRFQQKFSWTRLFRFFGDEGLGVPVAEAENGVRKLQKFLSKNLTDQELPEIKPLIVFINQVELVVQAPSPVPAMRSNELKSFLRENNRQRVISAPQRAALVKIIGGDYQSETA